MKFWEAMKALEEGKKVRNSGWRLGDFVGEEKDSIRSDDINIMEEIYRNWELYEEPVQMLSFQDMVKGLKEGKRFKRKDWASKYIYADIRFGFVVSHIGLVATIKPEDFEAADWIEVKE